ncbi:MAG TPA: recombination protein RecR [Phaeodactylibacter sp.]|nr:recombination protein RecR [Phaeodactylibacter sp.]
MNYPSKLIEDAVMAFSSLPGIGKKTALRLVLHLLKQEGGYTEQIAHALQKMRREIKQCSICNNISDGVHCNICLDKGRDSHTICVVESIRDVMAIEDTGQYKGGYHILGGVISPIEGIGPEDIDIAGLMKRVQEGEVKELVMAISPTIDGDTTIFFIGKQLQGSDVKISTIARGISFGGELEYADEMTLGRSIVARTPYRIQEE